MPAYNKGGGSTGDAGAGPSAQHHEDPQVIHTPWGDWTPSGPVDPHAMMAYVDHDHHAPTTVAEMVTQAQADVSKAKLAAEPGKTPEQRAKDAAGIDAGARLVALSRNMNDKNSKAFIAELDSMNDPELRHKAMAEFEAETGQKLDTFITGCNDWNNNGDNRDKTAALQLISKERDQADDEIAKMNPQQREAKRQQIAAEAAQLNDLTSKRDHSDENSQKIFKLLEGKSPAEIEMLRAAVRADSKGQFNLYERIDYGMHKGDETEGVMMLSGNKVDKVRAALCNEDDPKRLAEVVGHLTSKEDLAEINREPFKSMALARIKNPSDRAVLAAALEGNHELAVGERLGNLLEPKDKGMTKDAFGVPDKESLDNFDRRKAKNVLREFEAMSPEECKSAVAAYDAKHGAGAMEKMLEARWGNDDDKTELNRIKAMMEGDKGKNRSLRFEEARRDGDKDEMEAALRHEEVNDKDLHSDDKKVREHAEAIQRENASFERNNIEDDHERRVALNMMTGRHDDTTGKGTEAQLNAYFAQQQAKDVSPSYLELDRQMHGDLAGAAVQHLADRGKHMKEVGEDQIAAMELVHHGKLTPETEFHRGKGAKEKAEALENITNNKDLEAAQKAYKDKYGEDMLPVPKTDRNDMNANELMIDNIRKYGARAERPAQLEALLQQQQIKVQYSASLEADEDGAGTQAYQRILAEKQNDMLKDPKFAVHAPKIVKEVDGHELPFPQLVEDPDAPKFEDYQSAIDKMERDAPHHNTRELDDGLKDGVKKSEFTALDKHLVEVNKSQEEAKKALAERYVKIFSTIAKIAAVLTANPWLIAAIDIGEGLLEMAVKSQVMGEAYDPSDDLKMLAITGVADAALIGLTKLGELKAAAKIGESQAVSAGEKAAMEVEHATTAEAKTEAVREGAQVAAGESKALQGAIEEGGALEKAAGREVGNQAASRVEQKAAEMAEGKALQEGEGVAAKTAEAEAAQGTLKAGEGAAAEGAMDATKAAEQIKARYGIYAGLAKGSIQTVGGGVVTGKSPTDILKGLVANGLTVLLPGHLAGKVRAAIGNSTLAAKVLSEIASFGTEVTTNTTINGVAGNDGALLDATLGAAGGRAQRAFGNHGPAAKPEEEHAPTVANDEQPAHVHEEPAASHETPAAAAEEAPIAAPEPSAPTSETRAGAGSAHVAAEKGATNYRGAVNSERVSGRAHETLASMEPATRQRHEALLANAESPAHRVLMERALAAGHSYEEIQRLQHAMTNMSEAEVLREFSGDGVVQAFQQGCVPTAYQIAIAEVDPVYALHLRNNPDAATQAQREALTTSGGAATRRSDLQRLPQPARAQLEDGLAGPQLHDDATYVKTGDTAGIEATSMQGQPLHQQLEQVTGKPYEVITNEARPHQTPGADSFNAGNLPHERIGRALDAQQPVLFNVSMPGGVHEQTIIGRKVGANGDITYIVADPMSGSSMEWPQSMFDVFPPVSMTLPSEGGAPAARAPVTGEAGHGTRSGGLGGETELGGPSAEHTNTPALDTHTGVASETAQPTVHDVAALKQRVRHVASTEAAEAPTSSMSAERTAAIRTKEVRALMKLQEVMGIAPGTDMDPRLVARARQQQDMVDTLAAKRAELSPEQIAVAELMAESRRGAHESGQPTTKSDHARMQQLAAQAGLSPEALAAMPPELRLLARGFTPDEIAHHFTARDVDADVIRDPSHSARDTQARGTTGARELPAAGDLNTDGTVRRPMTVAEARLAVDINSTLFESWREGGQFGKLIPESTVGGVMSGNAGWGPGSGRRIGGDLGELANTDRPADRGDHPVTSIDQFQTAGLDYPSAQNSKYITDPASGPVQIGPGITGPQGLHRVEGTITQGIFDAAEVCVGGAVMDQAQRHGADLARIAQERTASGATPGELPHIPTMLETAPQGRIDASGRVIPTTQTDTLPNVMERTRQSQDDTRTGLGYSTTERLGMSVVPNQELSINGRYNAQELPPDARVTATRADGTHITALVRDPATGEFVLTPEVLADPTLAQYYQGLLAENLRRNAGRP